MDSDPPLVGALCSHSDCHNHDFLPTKCLACTRVYCTVHYFPEAHHCKALASTASTSDADGVERTSVVPCAFESCKLPCLESYAKDEGQGTRVPAMCSRCSLSFCPQHRFPDTHECKAAVPPQPSRNEAARALLAKNFPSHNIEKKGNSTRSSGTTPRKQQSSQGTRRVQLMKMRQSATPGDPKGDHLDMQERLHIQVKVDKSNVYKTFWFRKSISTGRALDLLQQRLETSPLKTWTLIKEFEDSEKAPEVLTTFDRSLSEEFEDGCKVMLIPSD